MAHETAQAHQTASFTLPNTVFGPVEVRRLRREVEALEEYMTQAALRESGSAQSKLPRTSHMLETLAEENRLNLLQAENRQALKTALEYLDQRAPVLHISFASDPSAAFTAKIVSWLRQNIHPHALLRVGLQPTIVAGCVVRTTNRSFDFSLRHRFSESHQLLLDALEGNRPKQLAQTPANTSQHAEGAAA